MQLIVSLSLYCFSKACVLLFLFLYFLHIFFSIHFLLMNFILFCLYTSLYFHCNKGTVYLPKNVSVAAIIAFGDSLLDVGNNNYINTMTKSNFLPYGKDFVGGKPTGRFSNGKTLADFFGTFFITLSIVFDNLITTRFDTRNILSATKLNHQNRPKNYFVSTCLDYPLL